MNDQEDPNPARRDLDRLTEPICEAGDPDELVARYLTNLVMAEGRQNRLFTRDGCPVVVDDDGRLVPLDESNARSVLRRAAGKRSAYFDEYVIETRLRRLLRRRSWPEELPRVEWTTRVPLLGESRDGLAPLDPFEPYYPPGRLWYDAATDGWDDGAVTADLTGEVNEAMMRDAVRLLRDELLGEFPFVDEADVANALAMVLTPFLRLVIDGPTPLFLVDAPRPGTG